MAPIRKEKDWRKLHSLKKKRKTKEIEEYLDKNKKLQDEVEKETFEQVNINENNVHKRVNTISIALPGSILDNVPCAELQTYLIGQISRAACIYNVDEIIIFDDTCSNPNNDEGEETSNTWKNCEYFVKILQYLECPQYLRKLIYPRDKDLMYVGLLNPVEAPHHFRANQQSIYREGVIIDETNSNGKKSFAEVGLVQKVKLDRLIEPGTRVTVKLPPKCQGVRKLNGLAVSPWEPKAKLGIYWGYNVRLANSLSDIINGCPYKRGYNITVGTSDKGTPLNQITFKKRSKLHLLIVFGGLKGLEFALESDNKLDVDDIKLIFDHYVNTCPNQGTRTIRTEEAIIISLAAITNKLESQNEEVAES